MFHSKISGSHWALPIVTFLSGGAAALYLTKPNGNLRFAATAKPLCDTPQKCREELVNQMTPWDLLLLPKPGQGFTERKIERIIDRTATIEPQQSNNLEALNLQAVANKTKIAMGPILRCEDVNKNCAQVKKSIIETQHRTDQQTANRTYSISDVPYLVRLIR